MDTFVIICARLYKYCGFWEHNESYLIDVFIYALIYYAINYHQRQ